MNLPSYLHNAFSTAAAILLLTTSAAIQASQIMQIQVQDNTGRPLAGAQVCAGSSAAQRGELGAATTNASGIANLAILPRSASQNTGSVAGIGSGPAVSLLITVNKDGRGMDRSLPVSPQGVTSTPAMAILKLPATLGGPQCSGITVLATRPGALSLDSAAIRAKANQLAQLPRPDVGVELQRPEYCFGAAGQGCGDRFLSISSCLGNECKINAGSWFHDECCVRNRNGGMCDGKLEELATAQPIAGSSGQICMADFNKALRRLGTPLTWTRTVDKQRSNSTGTVDHAAYCAPTGAVMVEDEQALCCSRRVEDLGPVSAAAVYAALVPIEPRAVFKRCR